MIVNEIPVAELISLRPRFLKSVHLERDFHGKDTADGYLLTRGSITALSLLSRGVADPSYRAQCISGPYGSGKSALALYFAKLLDKEQHNGLRERARRSLGAVADALLPADGDGYVTVLATGVREGLSTSLVRNLKRSLETSGRAHLLRALSDKHAHALGNPVPGTRQVIALFEDLAELVVKTKCASGVIVVVDELGKLLEYAASNPDEGDIQILQEMAEAASRSHEHPLWFVTILHQQFSQYASRLGRRHQKEWARVQQRFFDIPCTLDGLDALQLVAAAMNGAESDTVRSNKHIRNAAQTCSSLAPRGSEADFVELCIACYPLHPTAVLLLPSLFRRFGQNERSLFSFISADEPFSLVDWMRGRTFDPAEPPFIRMPEVFDYAFHTLIGGAPIPQVARLCAETEDVFARLGDASPEQVAALKAVSILNIVGDASRLPASNDILELALTSEQFTREHLEAILASLESRRLITYRRFRNSFKLWEGSDIDIGERLTTAYQHLPTQSMVLEVAKELCPAPPLVARKHSYLKGMIRIFSVVPSSAEDMQRALSVEDSFDGHVVCCVAENEEQRRTAEDSLATCSKDSVIVMIAGTTDELSEAARDVAALEWIRHNTPGLSGDRVARQELEERRLEASIAFRSEWNRLFTPGLNQVGVYWRGEKQDVASSKALAELISRSADETFRYAPTIQNELINRRTLSSAAAAARRNLVEAMILRSNVEHLGIDGFPPERSIYESLLKESGIHRQNECGDWEFGRPSDKDPGLQRAWDRILEISHSDALQPVNVRDLFDNLSKPPFGVADGFVPVLFYACLHANARTMALYGDGTFVPEVQLPVMERLMRNPGNYSVLKFELEGERAAVVERFSNGFDVENTLLPVVRHLYASMGSLTKYAETTRNLPDNAIAVRDAILRAKSPERLLFVELPTALECRSFEGASGDNTGGIETFFNALNESFRALIDCYPKLLLECVKSGIFKIFGVSDRESNWRSIIPARAEALSELVTDAKLRTVINCARDRILGDFEYLELMGASIVGQPPREWNRADEELFDKQVSQLAAKTRLVEALEGVQSSLEDSEEGYVITINTKSHKLARQPVRLTKPEHTEVERIAGEILATYSSQFGPRLLLAAVAEAARQVIILSNESDSDQAEYGEP